jgi:hypothetical protein
VILFHVAEVTNPSKTGLSPGSHIADAKVLLTETKKILENPDLEVQIKTEPGFIPVT